MELIERPNMRGVHYLNGITFKRFRAECVEDANHIGDKPPKDSDVKAWYSSLKQFCKAHIKTGGIVSRIYSYSMNTPKGLGGRLYSGGSAQNIWGRYRGLLFREITTDIDMKNAHPVILRWVCRKHGIPCPNLEYYINNRDNILKKFPNREAGKRRFLCATNDDKPLKDKKAQVKELQDYDTEMKGIQKRLVAESEYQELIDTIPPEKRADNMNGSAINRIMCFYENIILGHAIHVVNRRGIEAAILMFDGLQVYGDYYTDEGLLKDIADYVESQTPGLNMEWAYKPQDTTIVVPDQFDESNYKTENSDIPWMELTEAYFAKMLGTVCFDEKPILTTGPTEKLLAYRFTGVYWKPLPLHNADLMKENFDKLYEFFKEELELVGFDDKERARCMTSLKTLQTRVSMVNILKIFKDNHYVPDVEFDKNPDLFVFENKVYDLARGEIVEPNPEDYMSLSCGYNYPETRNHEVEQEIVGFVNGLFDCEIVPFVWKVLASFLKQQNIVERAYFFLGSGRNGKGTLTTLLNKALGKYWGELPVDYYTCSVKEADRPNQALYNCRNSRVLNTSEVDCKGANSQTVKFLEGKFKVITGRDTITARELGTKNVAYFKAGTPLIQLNTMPEFSATKMDIGLKERIVVVPFPYTFVGEDDPRLNTSTTFKMKDTSLKNKFDSVEYQQGMIYLLFQKYKLLLAERADLPRLVVAHTNAYFGSLGISVWFKNTYPPIASAKLSLKQVQEEYSNEVGKRVSMKEVRDGLEGLGKITKAASGDYFIAGFGDISNDFQPSY